MCSSLLLVKQNFLPGLHIVSGMKCFDLLCHFAGLYACITLGLFGLCKYLQISMRHFVRRHCAIVSSSPAVCVLTNLLVLPQWVGEGLRGRVRSKLFGKVLHDAQPSQGSSHQIERFSSLGDSMISSRCLMAEVTGLQNQVKSFKLWVGLKLTSGLS